MSVALANLRSWLSWHYFLDAGGALWEGIAVTADGLSDLLRQAVRVRLPARCPADALPEIAANYNLEPPAAAMSTQALRDYLADPWTLWRHAGTRGRILDELALLGLTSCTIVSWRNLADGGNPGAFGGDSSCWYLLINQPHPFLAGFTWDDGSSTWDQADEYWDALGPLQTLLQSILRVIAKWKPAASSCRFIELVLPGANARIPVREAWEYDAAGGAPDYYNTGY